MHAHELDGLLGLPRHLLRGAVRQGTLGADAAIEGDLVPIQPLQLAQIHALGLHRVEGIHPHLGELLHDFHDISTGMNEHILAIALDEVVFLLFAGLNHGFPAFGRHD